LETALQEVNLKKPKLWKILKDTNYNRGHLLRMANTISLKNTAIVLNRGEMVRPALNLRTGSGGLIIVGAEAEEGTKPTATKLKKKQSVSFILLMYDRKARRRNECQRVRAQ
jgi:hypothetical protein